MCEPYLVLYWDCVKDIQDAITINLNKSKRAFETASANRRGSGNKGN